MEAQTGGLGGSALTFVPSQEPTEPIRFDQLRRVREPVSRSKAGVQGKVADVISGRSRHAESLNELQALRVVMATAHADSWQEQPFVLEYHHEGKKHRYTPDLLVVWGTRREVVEVKEDAHAELPENQKRFGLIGELLGQHGYQFRVWKKSEICTEPRLSNVKLVLRYRSVEVSAAEREKIRRLFSTTAEICLQTFREINPQSTLRLVLDGTLFIDWWRPLTLDSRVSIAPIGRQVWPVPPPISSLDSVEGSCH
jgi:hypothetical protein